MKVQKRRGMVLLLAIGFLLVLVLVLGCSVDVGRILVTKSRLQGEAQAAAMAAVLELDGTEAGLERARAEAARLTGDASVRLEFAQDASAAFEEQPASPDYCRIVRVTASAPVPVMVLRTESLRGQTHVWGTSIAAQRVRQSFTDGLFPYSPLAVSGEGPSYGFQPGQLYSLRWAAHPSLEAGNVCPGDSSQLQLERFQSERYASSGYIESESRTAMRRSILYDYQGTAHSIGDQILMSGGSRPLERGYLVERIQSDTDSSSPTYEAYVARGNGNGRRLVAVPIHSAHPEMRIVQIGAFFLLPPASYPESGDQPFCAEYAGPYMQGSRWKAAGDAGYYVTSLLQ